MNYKQLEVDCNKVLHPPYIQVEIQNPNKRGYLKYTVQDNYGNHITEGKNLRDITFNLNMFFSI